jgi:hypothetical protein
MWPFMPATPSARPAGLAPGAGIAFLTTGPATNLSTLGVLSSLQGKRTAAVFAAVLVAFAVAARLTIDFVFGSLDVPTLAELTEEAPSTLQLLSLAGLLVLLGASIARLVRAHGLEEIARPGMTGQAVLRR